MSQINVDLMADSQGGSVAPISSVMRNRIINGAMVINQRGGTVTATTGGTYGVDRFFNYANGGGVFTAVQSTTVPAGQGFINSNLLTVTTADSSIGSSDYYSYGQFIEGYNIADLMFGTASAKTITLSFWVQSSVTGLYAVAIINNNGSRCFPATFTITTANTWQQIILTIPGDTGGTWIIDNGVGFTVRFDLGSGSANNGTANAWNTTGGFVGARTSSTVNWIATNGATFFITGVQLEKGTQATGFEYRQIGAELALCQRYCNVYGENIYSIFGTMAFAFSGTGFSSVTSFPVEMRAVPTVAYTGNVRAVSGSDSIAVTSATFNTSNSSKKIALVEASVASGLTVNRGYFWSANNDATARVIFSAEL